MSTETVTQVPDENAATDPAAAPQTAATATATTEEKPKAKARAKAPDTSTVDLTAINAAALAMPDLISAAAPTRERSDQQKAMDEVAKRAYAAWVEAHRPAIWQKMPVVTYFLDDADVPKYRYLIRRAASIVEPADGSPGVRVRFGNEFTLSETMAAKIKKPELAGKTVLAWAAIDKRATEDSNGTDKTAGSPANTVADNAPPKPGKREAKK